MLATKRNILPVILLFSCLFLCSADSFSDDEKGLALNVPRTDASINVDGVLNEKAWENAFTVNLKYETYPGENIAAPVKTEVFITYDNSNIYVAFKAYDPDPSQIRARYKDRDSLWGEDSVAISLDTFNDSLRAYRFECNPLGVQADSYGEGGHGSSSWDAIWDSAGVIYDWGYVVEMAIPFNVLRFQLSDEEQVWGMFAERSYPRSTSHFLRNTPDERGNNCELCQSQKIKGFNKISPGRNVEINPTISSIRMDHRPDFPAGDLEELDTTSNVGISGKWGITPNYTLSAAINPDFSQIEADSLYLTINERFTIRRSEKRPFFLEGSEYFDDIHTRTIVDPSWGLKLTGREGDNSYGVIAARDEVTSLIFPGSQGSDSTTLLRKSDAFIFSYGRDIGNNSTLRAMVTNRQSGDYYNRVVAAGGNFRLTKNDRLSFSFTGSNTKYDSVTAAEYGQSLDDFSGAEYSVSYSRSTRNWRSYAYFNQVGEDLRTDLDHKTMVGYRSYGISTERNWYGKPDDFFTNIEISFDFDSSEEIDGALLEKEFDFSASISGSMQSMIDYRLSRSTSGYYGKEYENWTHILHGGFQATKDISLFFFSRMGDAIDYMNNRQAKVLSFGPSFDLYAGKHLKVSLEYDYTRMEVDGARLYMTNTLESGLTYQFNSRMFIRSILQYADIRRNQELYLETITPETRSLFTQLLFSYKINPRTVLYVGYSDNYYGALSPDQALSYGLTQSDRTVFFKLGYAWLM